MTILHPSRATTRLRPLPALLGLLFAGAGAAYVNSDEFRLSSDFKPTATENGGHRDNAYREDRKLSLKVGLTPNAGDKYALSYYKQDGEKGQPPSTDPAAARYWQWPFWDKESVYFVSKTKLGASEWRASRNRTAGAAR